MTKLRRIFFVTGTSMMWLCILCFFSMKSCRKFEPNGFLYISTDTINMESGFKGIYEFKGSIVNIGEERITQHGFCWDENQMPYTSSDTTALGETNSRGVFTSTIEGLNVLSSYHVRAYVVTSKGTFYGQEKTFVTTGLSIPTVHTAKVIHINKSSAECGGNVIDEGVAPVKSRGVCWSTSQEPSLADNKTIDGDGAGSFSSSVTGLELNTVYYLRAYATSSEGTAYGDEVFFKTWDKDDFADFDGNVYGSIVIGEQTWMRQNLRVTHYADGTPIQEVVANWEWNELRRTGKAYCWSANDISNADLYGALYTWTTAMNGAAASDQNPSGIQGVCPDGWHLPSDDEWKQLEIQLGMDPDEADLYGNDIRGEGMGGKLKESGNVHWKSPNAGATNLSGFTALPGGSRGRDGWFGSLGYSANFFTASKFNSFNVWTRSLRYSNSHVRRGYNSLYDGASVRCVKDE